VARGERAAFVGGIGELTGGRVTLVAGFDATGVYDKNGPEIPGMHFSCIIRAGTGSG
jgi:hypothetical protein